VSGNVKRVLAVSLAVLCQSAAAQSLPDFLPDLWPVDPLSSEPAELNQPLRLLVPPEWLASPATPSDDSGNDLAPLELDCATRAIANDPDNAQQALQTLRTHSATAVPVLSLPTAIQLAICHNPTLRATWSQIAQQSAQLGQARSAWLPQLNAGISRLRSRVSYPGSNLPDSLTEMTAKNAVLNWRLWDFGARNARIDAAQAQVQAALSSQSATLQKVMADLLNAYAEAQAAQARLLTQRQLLPLAERNLLSAQRRQAGGAGSANDTLQARTAQARIELEHSRAEGDLRKTQAQLVFQTGLPPGTVFELSPLLPDATAELSETAERLLARTLDDWLDNARQNHPAMAAARAQLAAAQATLKAVRADGLPTLELSLGHYIDGRPNQSLNAFHSRENFSGVTLNIPLFDGFTSSYKIRTAQAAVEQKAIELQATEQQTLQELVQRHAEAHASLGNLRAAAHLYHAADAAAQSSQRQYEHGALDILQLNHSLTALQQAQDDLMRCQLEWSRARIRLWLGDGVGE
jgi:outer membrane protein